MKEETDEAELTAKPLVFVTGFLGAGKTTLLRSLTLALREAGRSVDIVINDFANAELDAATLEEVAASVAPIAASCACCESTDELIALCGAALAGEGDLLLVELNGTADPLPLLEVFTLLEDKLPFFPRLQLSLIDAREWGRRGPFAPLERRQLETAGLWIPTHLDAVSPEREEEVDASVRAVSPLACRIDMDVLAGFLLDELDAMPGEARSPQRKNPSNFRVAGTSVHDEVHHLSHRFTGISIPLPPRVRRGSVEELLCDLPPSVMRAKALVRLSEYPAGRWLFQRTGADDFSEPIPVPEIRRVPPSLVCVGPRLDPEELRGIVARRWGAAALR